VQEAGSSRQEGASSARSESSFRRSLSSAVRVATGFAALNFPSTRFEDN